MRARAFVYFYIILLEIPGSEWYETIPGMGGEKDEGECWKGWDVSDIL
jgi:hypothetical protein